MEKHIFLKKVFLNFYFCLWHQFCVPYWWKIPNQSILFEGNKNQWKKTSPKYNFFFDSGSSVLPLTTMSFKKTFSSKNLSIEIVFELQVSITLIIFLCSIDLLLQTFQKFFRENSFLWKESSAKKNFSFLSSEFCTPTHNIVKISFMKTLTKKKHFFPNYIFLSFFVCSPIDESYKTNLIFIAKAIFSEKRRFSKLYFLLCIIGPWYLHWELCRSKKFSKEEVFRKTTFLEF